MQFFSLMVFYGGRVNLTFQSEELVTIRIIEILKNMGWNIISYDFPQSGTGLVIHPNNIEDVVKKGNDGTWIPDIIATKGKELIFLENKVNFSDSDSLKISKIKKTGIYEDGINKLSSPDKSVHFGMGFVHTDKNYKKCMEDSNDIDFYLLISCNSFILRKKSEIEELN